MQNASSKMMSRIGPASCLFWGLAATFLPWTSTADGQISPLAAFQEAVIESITEAERSVVALVVLESPPEAPIPLDADPFEFTIRQPGRVPSRFGSGVIVRTDDDENSLYVLTNQHLVETPQVASPPLRTRRIVVRLMSRHTFRATVHAADPRSDLAVLRVSLEGSGLRASEVVPVTFGEGDRLRKGTFVITLGNPLALARDGSSSASLGIISNHGRAPLRQSERASADQPIHRLGTLLHIDTLLEIGSSGGAVVDLDGRLIGLTSSLAAMEGDDSAGGLAIPLTSATRRQIDSLLNGFEVEYGYLGTTTDTAGHAEFASMRPPASQPSAARVNRVGRNSPGERGGLRAEDVILRVNDTPVYSGEDLVREVGLLGPEAVAELEVYRPRAREHMTLSVTLGKWPVYDDSGIVATADRYPAWRGLKLDYSTARRRYLPTAYLSEYDRAVVITDVQPESPADRAGLKIGQFITKVGGREVETPREFHSAAVEVSGPVRVTLRDGTEVDIAEQSP